MRWILVLILLTFALTDAPFARAASSSWWQIQSVDTMKYSRDLSGQIQANPEKFSLMIDSQVAQIAAIGATHVGIATPYDAQFLPVLRMWVDSARRHQLKVWFRGNFSGWEQWFGYRPITREQHKELTREFIRANPDLFEDGDAFSACPECENGGPGDPRLNGDVEGHKQFLIDLYNVSRETFHSTGKNVTTNLHSMNGDVARLIMDPETTKLLGGVVTVDHYVEDPDQLAEDIKEYAKISGGKVMLGEYGAPIPDIHGDMSEEEQRRWIDHSLSRLSLIPELIGLNYWVNIGGSTALWTDEAEPKLGVSTLKSYFSPQLAQGVVKDEFGHLLSGVTIKTPFQQTQADEQGEFSLPVASTEQQVTIMAKGYITQDVPLFSDLSDLDIILKRDTQDGWFSDLKYRLELLWMRIKQNLSK